MIVYSNRLDGGRTADELRNLEVLGTRDDGSREQRPYVPQELSRRLGGETVAMLVERSRAGESATSLAKEVGVAPSALIRMLRDHGVEVQKRKVPDGVAQAMATEYKAGATMRDLEAKYGLSHGVVFRALHRVGNE